MGKVPLDLCQSAGESMIRELHVPSSPRVFCWDTFYIFAYYGPVGNPHSTTKQLCLLPFQCQPSYLKNCQVNSLRSQLAQAGEFVGYEHLRYICGCAPEHFMGAEGEGGEGEGAQINTLNEALIRA